jgi:subtilisin family serine protease
MKEIKHRFQYVILQDENASRRKAQPRLRGAGPSLAGTESELSEAPPELNVTSAELSAKEAADARRAPETLEVARRLPLKLISPLSADAFATSVDDASWGLKAVGALNSVFDGEPITVAVLDTGIDKDHPAFNGVTLERKNFTSETDDDVNGHGTHCAGTIFGRDVDEDGKQIRIGVAPGIRRALIGKVLGEGAGTDSLISSITWARDQGAQVISMSLGYDHAGLLEELEQFFPKPKAASELLAIFVENIRQFDSLAQHLNVPVQDKPNPLIVAASGNESEADATSDPFRISASSPSSALGVISVGALQQDDSGKLVVAPFSNTNVDISAPGVGILSAGSGGGLLALSGTSMACPHVAGIATLWWHRVIQNGLPRTSSTVLNHMMAGAARNVIGPDEVLDDFGIGVAQAP